PRDRDRVDPLVVLADRPRALLERVSGPPAQVDREAVSDVQADDGDGRGDAVADRAVRQRREHERPRQDRDGDDGVDRYAMRAAHLAEERATAGDGPVA